MVDAINLLLEVTFLILLSLTEIAVFVVSGLSGSSGASEFGFINRTGEISNNFTTEITPASFAFSIWGAIYAWDALWIIYAWIFVFRPNAQRTISLGIYLPRILVNCLNITWLYLFGNNKIVSSCVILYLFAATFYISNALLVIYFFNVLGKVNKMDRFLTYLLPINGMFFYATWGTIASQLNLTIAIQYNASLSKENSATVGLSILLSLVVVYFILESTIAERYLRYVFSVYPVIIWAGSGILADHWNDDEQEQRNKIFTLAIVIIASVFLIAKVGFSIICTKLRPNETMKYREHEKLKNDETLMYS